MRTVAVAWMKVKGFILALQVGVATGLGISHLQEAFDQCALLVASALVFIFSCLLMQRAVGVFHFRRLTIPGFWFLTYLVMIFIPSFFVFLSKDSPRRYTYLFSVQSVIITVPLGILCANMVLRFRRDEIRRYFESPLQELRSSAPLAVACLIGLLGALGIALMYVHEVETLPLLYLVRNPGDYETLVVLREQSFKLLDSPFTYIYYLLRVLGFPFLIMLTLGYYILTGKGTWLALFLASLGSGILYAAFSIAKAPVAAIMGLIFLFLYLYGGGRVSKGGMVAGSVLVPLFPLAVVWGMSGDQVTVAVALSAIGKRIFYEPAEVLYWYFELFPGAIGYLHGRSIGFLSWLSGWEYFNTSNYVGLHGLGSRIDSVNANAAFIGDLNADFGMIGVLVGGIVAGALMESIQICLVRRPKTILNLVVYAYLTLAFWMLHSTALSVVLGSNGVILAILLPGIIRTMVGVLRPRTARVVTR